MRPARLLGFSALLVAAVLLFHRPLGQAFGGLARADPVGRIGRLADAGQEAIAKEAKAVKTAQEGMACLNGTGPCPHGRRSPFK